MIGAFPAARLEDFTAGLSFGLRVFFTVGVTMSGTVPVAPLAADVVVLATLDAEV